MTQDASQVTTTPPLPGLSLVQAINQIAETLGTDFAGATDPAAMAWAYSTWADTSTTTIKRRNAANSAWVIEGRLFLAHMPIIPLADVPTTDIGPIHIIGKGAAEWSVSAYKVLTSGIPGATFAEIDALTADQGPIIAADQDGILYAWDAGTSKYIAQTADEATALAKSSRVNLLTPAGLGFSLQPEVTDEATFTKLTNNIELTDIRDELALEIGDVIQISGSANNDNLYTVESIVDADNVIVNYEHRNGAGSLSLTDETGTVTVKRVTKWFNAPTGLGQSWVDVSLGRLANTTYVNNLNRTVNYRIEFQANSSTGIGVTGNKIGDGLPFGLGGYSTSAAQSAQLSIPPHTTYTIGTPSGSHTYMRILELR